MRISLLASNAANETEKNTALPSMKPSTANCLVNSTVGIGSNFVGSGRATMYLNF